MEKAHFPCRRIATRKCTRSAHSQCYDFIDNAQLHISIRINKASVLILYTFWVILANKAFSLFIGTCILIKNCARFPNNVNIFRVWHISGYIIYGFCSRATQYNSPQIANPFYAHQIFALALCEIFSYVPLPPTPQSSESCDFVSCSWDLIPRK